MSLALGSEHELAIERLAAGGDGVARVDGLAVFVTRVAPGDRLRARITESAPRFARAEVVEILEAGPARREANCPFYERCGGCTWLHLDEREQTRARREITAQAFARIAKLEPPPLEALESPLALGYRARARVAFEPGRIGFRARASHDVVDVTHCAVLDPDAQAALDRLRAEPPPGRGEREVRGFGAKVLVDGRALRVPPDAFFQANRALWAPWQALVADACGSGERAVELYAGAGFFTAALGERFASVTAVERGRAARDAKRNARARVVEASAEDWAPTELARLEPEVVLLNPPRGGCHRSVSEAILRSGARRVVYVSCDPATLARDLALLAPRYRLVRSVVIDALPQTHHVEVVAILEDV